MHSRGCSLYIIEIRSHQNSLIGCNNELLHTIKKAPAPALIITKVNLLVSFDFLNDLKLISKITENF